MTPIVGAMSEKMGFARALMIAAVVPLVSAALMWLYPKEEHSAGLRAQGALAVAD